jgi:hypothetical protein
MFNQQGGFQLLNYDQSQGFQGLQGQGTQGQGAQGAQGTQGAPARVPGQELLSETNVSFKERLLKMLGEIGQPISITRSKNGIRAIWHGDSLKAPYTNTFHRVYLNCNDAYPVMTVARIKNIDENLASKLSFICDRFKVVSIHNKVKDNKKKTKKNNDKDCLLILRGPSFKSNLAKTALALSAIKGKVSFCKICDDELSKKWVWALNPSSQRFFDPKAKIMYSKICNSLGRN